MSLSFALGGGFSFDETLLNSFSSYESEGFASLRGGGFLSSFFFHLSFSSYESEGFASLRGGGSSLMKEERRPLLFSFIKDAGFNFSEVKTEGKRDQNPIEEIRRCFSLGDGPDAPLLKEGNSREVKFSFSSPRQAIQFLPSRCIKIEKPSQWLEKQDRLMGLRSMVNMPQP